MRAIRFADKIVPHPMVIATLGAFSKPPKCGAAFSRVIGFNSIALVSEFLGDLDSLKPMWPVRPIPEICKSMPLEFSVFR